MFNKRFRGVSPASFEVRQVSLALKTAERSSPKVGKRFFEELPREAADGRVVRKIRF